jgi:hypothetical protein
LPDAETTQFQKAETAEEATGASTETCHACWRAFTGPYFWVNGAKVCSPCGVAIQASQRAPRPHLFLKAFFWGVGAALAGTIHYATVTIITGIQVALISILIGYLVGKAFAMVARGAAVVHSRSWPSY